MLNYFRDRHYSLNEAWCILRDLPSLGIDIFLNPKKFTLIQGLFQGLAQKEKRESRLTLIR